ncbi:hypothetical protein PSH76_07280 [Pseudomonas sp. FP215]|uniref:hypothetical protein n=1 Tax=Pseudomonas sp. FP215 TaxID=2738126 RepID=UPI0027359744|nr:hypothetical protein [Pseudomonas sp. FP215]WLH25634.1 hypothetical protein PSH76_07280 [Pseudomonas sp. FP215]
MAKQPPVPASNTSPSVENAPKPQRPKPRTATPNALEVNAPLISSEVHSSVVPSAMKGSYLTVDPRMDSSDITVKFGAKEAPELLLEDLVDSSGESGARDIDIPLDYLTTLMGFTALISYTGRSQGQVAASLVKEVRISFYPESESEELAPRQLHEKLLHNTPTYDMNDHPGNETVLVPLHPLAKAGDKVYCTAVTKQDAPPHTFYTVIYDHLLTEEDVASGTPLRPEIARGWLARRKPWRSITLQSAWITSGLPAKPYADVDPHLETRLPRNALEVQRRRTAALIVAPELDLPPPRLKESVEYNGEWWLNPELTREGGHVEALNLDTYAGDRVCFYVNGPGYGRKLLDCVTIEHDGDLPAVTLSPCIVACFFDKSMTLTYTLAFNDNEQQSPGQVVSVSAPQFPHPDIEEATRGTLDLRTFSENAMAKVPVWAYAECSNQCWMWATGEHEDGSAYRFDILAGVAVIDDWKAHGVDAPIRRSDLQKLADCSTFTLHFAVAFCDASTLANAQVFPSQVFNIEQEPLVLPEPSVTEAVGSDLTAWNGRGGVHVEVNYVGNNPKHSISVCWRKQDDTCWPLISKPGSTVGPVIFALPPEAVIEGMGKTIPITYTVATACKLQTSLPLNLNISLPTRLETPNVLEATPPNTQNAILDTRIFAGNANSHEDPMWFLRAGQKCRLRATGTDKNDTPYTFDIYADRTITPQEVTEGVTYPVLRTDLDKLKDNTNLTLTFSVATDASLNENVVCPSRTLIVRVITLVTEDFTTTLPGYFPAGSPAQTPTMTITARSGIVGIHAASPAVPGMTSGNAIALSCSTGTEGPTPSQSVDLFLKREYLRVRFAFTRNAYYGVCYFYGRNGELLGTRSGLSINSWVDFSAPDGKLINKISVVSQQHSYLDSFQFYY